ncbi:MAG TPA: GTP-binding protein, partial [Sediminispirochaeta sp.]|nr:GTP-binding protein [Sediminispirochaeta sp.]
VEVQLDYGEDELEAAPEFPRRKLLECRRDLEELLATYRTGKIYQEGVKVALAGPTNAGKSSLFNLFLREDRSIVSGVHGTTRDYIESWITVSGIPVRLYDTAGLREAEHPVEAEGIKRSGQVIEGASLVLYLADGSAPLRREDLEVQREHGEDRRYIFVWNKLDLKKHPAPAGWYGVSAETGEGFEALEGEIGRRILGEQRVDAEVMIDSERQRRLIEGALSAVYGCLMALEEEQALDIVALDLKEALDALGEITGEVSSADILQQIFGDFCVGK